MPGTASEKIFSFNVREIKKGQLAGKILAADFCTTVTDRIISVKYVLSYYIQSRSKLLGLFIVFLSSQFWCTRFDELNVINNIGRQRRWVRSKKTALAKSVSNTFCCDRSFPGDK